MPEENSLSFLNTYKNHYFFTSLLIHNCKQFPLIYTNQNTYLLLKNREGTTMVAKLQAMFDKSDYEKGHALATNMVGDDNSEAAKSGDTVRAALLDKISTGKVGSLTVDPQFLDFEALECKYFQYEHMYRAYTQHFH